MRTSVPFDDFRDLVKQLPAPDAAAADAARSAFAMRNSGESAGRLADLAAWFASSGGSGRLVGRPQLAIFAGTHGVLRHGISHQSVGSVIETVQRCGDGSAAICRICQTHDLGLKVFDLALDLPTADITQKAALDERASAATMAFGMEALIDRPDLLCLGSFGAGSDTVAAALLAVLFGGAPDEWLEGSDQDLLDQRRNVLEEIIALHGPFGKYPFETLCRIGGREFSAIAGAVIAAGAERVPVILHGAAAFASAAVLTKVNPRALSHCILAQTPANPRMSSLAESLGLASVFDAALDGSSEQPLSGALALVAIKGAVSCAV